MKVGDALSRIAKLGVETSPFIYFVEQNNAYLDRIRIIFQQADSEQMEIVTSTVTLTEVLVMPLQKNQPHYEREYREMLLNTAHIMMIPVSAAIAERAARLRATYSLRTPDALHVATAIESNCDAFLTNDFGLRRVTELKILVLDDLEV